MLHQNGLQFKSRKDCVRKVETTVTTQTTAENVQLIEVRHPDVKFEGKDSLLRRRDHEITQRICICNIIDDESCP